MKKTTSGQYKIGSFFSGKGFYIALAISLVTIGAAAWFGINSAISKLEEKTPNEIETPPVKHEDDWQLPSEHTVDAPKKDVPAQKPADNSDNKENEKKTDSQQVQGFVMPVKGSILNNFSGDKMVKSKTLDDWVLHTGIDIAAKENTPVKAMSAGKVTEVKEDPMWGTTVTITHSNGLVSYYAGLKAVPDVKQNQKVNLGDVIGKVGNTAEIEHAEESHLHFGVKKDDKWIDPISLIKS